MRILCLFFCLAASPAFAKCFAGSEVFFSCTFLNGKKSADLCVKDDQIVYSFQAVGGEVELELTRSVRDVKYTPWPGIGRTIWESVAIENDGIKYEIYGSIDKLMGEDEEPSPIRGGVDVFQGEKQLAQLVCDEGSVNFGYGDTLVEAKKIAGQCFDLGERTWVECK